MCFRSGADDEQKRRMERTKEIDNMLKREAKQKVHEVKLLLLG